MKKILLSILIASCSILQAQTPCINGMAGDYPCNGYDLQSFIPFSALMGASEGK